MTAGQDTKPKSRAISGAVNRRLDKAIKDALSRRDGGERRLHFHLNDPVK